MKVTPGTTTSDIKQVNKQTDNVEGPPSPLAASSSRTQSDSKVQDKMLSLFARVGIAPTMSTNDASQRRHILERRRQIREMQKINNLQAILNIALNVSVSDKDADNVDPDWFFSFCNLAENIYSTAMQELWGKIFAVEVSHPGSFSRRSLQTLESLTHRDAVIFSRAVSVASRRSGDTVPRILVGYHVRKGLLSLIRRPIPEQLNISSFGLSYPDLLALQDMKLLYASEIESGEFAEGHHTQWRCGSESFELTSRRAGVALVYYKFTSVGAELFRLVGRHDNKGYLDALKTILGNVFVIQ